MSPADTEVQFPSQGSIIALRHTYLLLGMSFFHVPLLCKQFIRAFFRIQTVGVSCSLGNKYGLKLPFNQFKFVCHTLILFYRGQSDSQLH